MAVTGTISLTGTIAGVPEGTREVALSWTIAAGVANTLTDLASGANTITVPTGTTLVVLIPPTANTQTLTLKGVGGDTGFEISRTKPSVLAWQTGSSFVITAGGTVTGFQVLFV